jgi:hypothetical protein
VNIANKDRCRVADTLFGQEIQACYVSVVLMLLVSALVGWRLPNMLKQHDTYLYLIYIMVDYE